MSSAAILAQDGGEGGSSNFLIPNATIIAELVIFLVIFGVLWRFVVPPVKRGLNERQDRVRRQIEESEQARERLEAADARYREALAEARAEAATIREEARAEGQRHREELRSQADQEVARIRRSGEQQLAAARDEALRELRPQIATLAVTLAGRIAGNALEDEAQQRATIDRFTSELAELSGEPAREPTAPTG